MDEHIFDALAAGVPVITRGARLARVLRNEFDTAQVASGAAAWQSATVMSWTAWMSALWEEYQYATPESAVRLGPWQEWTLWDGMVRSSAEAGELLQAGAAAAAAQQSWALAVEWRLDLDRLELEGGDDAKAFARWARAFCTVCGQRNLVEEARVAGLLREALGRIPLPSKVLLAGFDEYSPQQVDFLEAVKRAGCEIESAPRVRLGTPGVAVRVPFADAEQGLLAAARWARALLERDGSASIGIVVPDLAERRAQVDRIFRAVLDPGTQLPGGHRSALVNLSAGESLADYPLVWSALALLRSRPDGNEWRDITALVLDRHIAGAEAERAVRASLDVSLRERGISRLDFAEVRQDAAAAHCPVLARMLSDMEEVWTAAPAAQRPGAWARTFAAMLEAAGWPGERPLDSVEYQTVEAWKAALSEFAATDVTGSEMRATDALSLLARIASGTVFQPESDAAPVQVMGTLEATGLQFDHLWVAGLSDDTWPPPPSPDPFLPVRMQREAGIPRCSAEQTLAFARKLTDRLLASSPDVVVSYPTREGDRELAPSPLILPLRRIAPEELKLWNDPTYDERIRASRAVERIVDEQGPALAAASEQRGGAKVFEYQAACPFHAFVELRLGAEDMESPEPGLDARSRGTLVHSALEHFWLEVRTHEALCTRADIGDVVRESCRRAVARIEERRGAPLPERFAALERRRLQQLVTEWLEQEKRREPFEVVQPEKGREAEVGGIRFRVRIDRIDRLRDGTDVIVDYKTGRPSIAEWDGARPDAPQLPLYSVVYGDRPLAGVAFAVLKPGAARFRGIAARAGMLPDADVIELEPRIAEWRAVLEKLAADFRNGIAAADPKDAAKSCRYCKLAGLCRISDGISDEEAA
jgi:probable DNA repair protein